MCRVSLALAASALLAACDHDPTAPGPGVPASTPTVVTTDVESLAASTIRYSTTRPLKMPADYFSARTHDVNDDDVLVGAACPLPSTGRPCVPARWDVPSTGTLLPMPTGTTGGGSARAVNSSGVVVGVAGGQALRWRPGAATADILPLPAQASDGLPNAINDLGDAVGRVGPSGAERAVLWDRSATAPSITLLQTGASSVTSAHAINDAGVIVGYRMGPGDMLPVRWTSATSAPQDLPLPEGYDSGEAEDIAEDGTIVGMISRNGIRDAAVWRGDATGLQVTVLPKPAAWQSCFATAISSGPETSRWIVGNCIGESVLWARDTVFAIGVNRYNGYSYGVSTSGLLPLLPSTDVTPTETLQLTSDPYLVSDPGGPYSASEGATVTFDGTASRGWPVGTPLTYEWTIYGTNAIASGATPSYTYPDNGFYGVGLRVSDGSGLPGPLVAAQLTVDNVAPSVDAGADAALDAGQSFTLGGTFTDPGVVDGPWAYWVDWGDGSPPVARSTTTQGTIPLARMYGKPGTYTVRLSVQDKDGGIGFDEVVVTVRGSAPTARAGGPYTGAEGSAIAFDGSGSSDPDGGVLTYSWSFGDGGTATGPTPQHSYADDGTYTVTLTVTDVDGQSHTATASATIANVPPRITTIGVPAAPVPLGTAVTVTAAFTGATGDRLSAVVSWDDGSTSPLSGVTTMLGATHTYATPGVYTVRVRVSDDDGSSDEQAAPSYVVVYDPSTSSFVAGAGTIASPAGSMPANPTASGLAAFGFQSRYRPGAQEPSGFTRFEFRAGGLEFEATRFDWLVVAGTKAQLRGEGTIAGRAGAFRFVVSAVDGGAPNEDRLRIKITDASGALVYDNQQGDWDGAPPATGLTNGSITVR